MPDLPTSSPVVAMAQPGAGQGNIWVQLFPFALMLLIFYVIVLLPMRRRQKKVQDFQASLKVGDRVITTGGIHGVITRLSDGTVQVQIADRVRIEVSRAAVAGYQGQEPVVQPQDSAGAS
jgi:preprotein translocase subunit YajC